MRAYLTREKYRRDAAKIKMMMVITAAIDVQFRTQAETAKALGCSQGTISNWHSLKGGSLPLIAVAMEVLGLELRQSTRRLDVRRTSRIKEGSHNQGMAMGQSGTG